MSDRDLTMTLAEFVAPFDHDPDGWDDVLRRAQAPLAEARPLDLRRPRRWSLHRWQLGTAAAALAVAAVVATPPGRAGAEWLGEQVGIGDPPSHHELVISGEPKESYVLAAGHDPDGKLYEFVLDRYPKGAKIADGERADACFTVDWTGSANPAGAQFCGPGFPPPGAFGSASARPFGYLNLYPQGTRYLTLVGFTEREVERVEVSYSVGGTRRDAPVDLAKPSDELLRRIGASKAANVFVAFLPAIGGRRPEGSGGHARGVVLRRGRQEARKRPAHEPDEPFHRERTDSRTGRRLIAPTSVQDGAPRPVGCSPAGW